MKKLMIAMSAAAMVSLCAMAADIKTSGVDFEYLPVGALDTDADDNGGGAGIKYWEGTGTVESQIVQGTAEDGNETKFLKVDETEPLTRTMNSKGAGPTVVDDGAGVYIKTKVQFTAADEAPSVTDGDKLLVWLQQIEEQPAVGQEGEDGYVPAQPARVVLMVTDKTGAVETDAEVNTANWYDLVIRATKSGVEGLEVLGFTVAINGTEVNGGQVFQSIVPSTSSFATTIKSIGFKGTGNVDDIEFGTFTEAEPIPVTLAYTCNDETSVSFMKDDVEIEDGGVANVGDTIVVAVSASSDATVTCPGLSFTYDEVDNDAWVAEYTITEADGEAGSKTFAITVTAGGGEEPGTPQITPSAGETEVSITATDANAAEVAALAAIKAPEGVDLATYKTYFKATAGDAVDGAYTVTVVLDEEKVTPQIAAEDEALDIAGGVVTVETKAGLYYQLVRGATVTAIETTVQEVVGDGSAMSLTDVDPLPGAGFYKITVTAAPTVVP